jgi:5'-nucleotidase
MAFDLSDYLVIGVSSRALFDLDTENRLFVREGLEAYSKHQIRNEHQPLAPGAAFPLVKAILRLNTLVVDRRRAEVVIMSRNSADTSLRIFTSLEHHGLDITRAALTGGAALAPYMQAYRVDLFLSADEQDVQAAVDAGVPAATVLPPQPGYDSPVDEIRIAFDGDAVLFSAESERIFQSGGIEAFVAHETANAKKPLPDGPFAKLLRTLSILQTGLNLQKSPIRLALITARNAPAHERVIRTLRAWNVRIDEAHFLGGATKAEVVRAFGAHIFFDDQDTHLGPAAKLVPAAKVPYPSARVPVAQHSGDPTGERTMASAFEMRVTGRALARKWKVRVRHALHHKDGCWYNNLERFPGALFDPTGYVIFATEEEYRACPFLSIGKETNIPKGLRAIPGYVAMPGDF